MKIRTRERPFGSVARNCRVPSPLRRTRFSVTHWPKDDRRWKYTVLPPNDRLPVAFAVKTRLDGLYVSVNRGLTSTFTTMLAAALHVTWKEVRRSGRTT